MRLLCYLLRMLLHYYQYDFYVPCSPPPLTMTEPVFGKGEYFWLNVFRPPTERLVPYIGQFERVLNKVKLLKPYLRCSPCTAFTFTPLLDFPDISVSEWFIPSPRSYLTTEIRRQCGVCHSGRCSTSVSYLFMLTRRICAC